MSDYSLQPEEDGSSCCSNEFQIHLDFVKFAEEQLSLHKNNSDIKVIFSRKEYTNPKYSAIPSRHALISEKSRIFTETSSNEERPTYPKLKHIKKESAFIQQKILNLQRCVSKTNEEIYGSDLLEAIKEFDNFVAKNWGRGENERKMKVCNFTEMEKLPVCANKDFSSSYQEHDSDSMNQLNTLRKKRPSLIDDDELTSSSCRDDNTDKSDSKYTLVLNNVCTLCQRKCSCEAVSTLKLEDQSTSKSTHESKGVNTELVSHLTTATNTAESTATSGARSEQLSKLTIRKQNPLAQPVDCGCGGEGGMPNSLQEFIKPEELSEDGYNNDLVMIKEDSKESCESESKKYPTDDMKLALELVNKALLHGHTGRDVAVSMSVILNDWFQLVGSKTVDANIFQNYLNTFSDYSPQLVRYMVNLPDENGITALHYAVSYGNLHVVSKLLETNVIDVNKPNKAGYTSIMPASLTEIRTNEQEQILRKLIQLGDVNIRAAQHGQTALMLAASHGRFKMVKLLLEAGAEVNAQDEDGSTALMCAVEHGHADIVQCLLAQPDCDPNLKDNDDLNALNVAMEAGHKDIAVLLYAHMNFFKKPSSLGTDKTLLLSKRSKSEMNSPCFESVSAKQNRNNRQSDLHFVAKKQNSSIN